MNAKRNNISVSIPRLYKAQIDSVYLQDFTGICGLAHDQQQNRRGGNHSSRCGEVQPSDAAGEASEATDAEAGEPELLHARGRGKPLQMHRRRHIPIENDGHQHDSHVLAVVS